MNEHRSISLATVHANPAFTPLALLCLKASLLERRILTREDVRILEFRDQDPPEAIARSVLECGPSLVGLSCYVWNVQRLLAVSRCIRRLQPGVRIVLGGPEVSPVARAVLEENPSVDCIVRGEGEIAFAELVDAHLRGEGLEAVKGICFRRATEIIQTAEPAAAGDLNLLASSLGLLDGGSKDRIACVETQRGCVFRCNFCFEGKEMPVRNRRFDIERVQDDLRYWLQSDAAWVYLMDPVFNLNLARAKQICRFIAEHNRRNIALHAEIWAEFVDEELARLMREAGFRFLEVGLQTTDESVLRATQRRLRRAPFLAGIEHLKQAGLHFQVQLIHGLPGETRLTFRDSLDFAAALGAPELAVFPLMVLPGTELRKQAAVLELDYDPQPPYYVRAHPGMSPQDITHGRRLAEAVNGVGRLWTMRLLGREDGTSYAEVIDAWIDWAEGDAATCGEREVPDEADCVRRFVSWFCKQRRIPPGFYEASSCAEFRARAAAGAEPS